MANRYDLTAFGTMGEVWVAQYLRRRGLVVEMVGQSSDYDLVLEGRVRVEVKSAFVSQGANGNRWRWQFSLRRHGLLVDEDLLVLLCWVCLEEPPVATFVIPGSALSQELGKVDITSSNPYEYKGKWARYRDDWSQVGKVLDMSLGMGQLVLFRQPVVEEIPF